MDPGMEFALAYCFLGKLNFAQGSLSSFCKSRSDEGVAKCELSEFRRKLLLMLSQSHYAPSWSLAILILTGVEMMDILYTPFTAKIFSQYSISFSPPNNSKHASIALWTQISLK